jgi:hypothetical protein
LFVEVILLGLSMAELLANYYHTGRRTGAVWGEMRKPFATTLDVRKDRWAGSGSVVPAAGKPCQKLKID